MRDTADLIAELEQETASRRFTMIALAAPGNWKSYGRMASHIFSTYPGRRAWVSLTLICSGSNQSIEAFSPSRCCRLTYLLGSAAPELMPPKWRSQITLASSSAFPSMTYAHKQLFTRVLIV